MMATARHCLKTYIKLKKKKKTKILDANIILRQELGHAIAVVATCQILTAEAHVGFVVNKAAMGQVFSSILFHCCSIFTHASEG
jgi:hypothetical protein